MLDHEIAAVQTGARSPAHVAERLRSTHIVRLAGALAGYGFFLRDLAHKTHSRVMDLLAERLLQSRRLPPGHQGPREHYGPAEPAQPWDAQRHAAWAAFALGSALDITLLARESRMRPHRPGHPQHGDGATPEPWRDILPEALTALAHLPARARQACTARALEEVHLQAWAEAMHDTLSAAVASGATHPATLGGTPSRRGLHIGGAMPAGH